MTDAVASLRAWGVRFAIGGDVFTIPPRPASDWIEFVFSGDVTELLGDDDIERLTDLAADGTATADELERIFADAVSQASGREWQVGARLAALLLIDDVRGEVLSCIDPAQRPFAAVLDVIYALMVRWKDEKGRGEFEAMLNAPPESMPGTSDPRDRARQLRERSKRLLAQQQNAATDTPSNETPPTSP